MKKTITSRNKLFKYSALACAILALAVAVMVLLPAGTPSSDAANGVWGGDGSQGSPYEISDAADLAKLATDVNSGTNYSGKYFVLTDNIVLTGTWTPIGLNNRHFSGTFDGKGYTVSGISITGANNDYAGLFGYSDGTIKNVGVVNTSISGGNQVGGIVGYNTGTVDNCYNTGNVNGHNNVGGVVGENHGTISNCYNTGAVSHDINILNRTYGLDGGGVVGYNYRGVVENCYNTGAVSGYINASGVVGSNDGMASNTYFSIDNYPDADSDSSGESMTNAGMTDGTLLEHLNSGGDGAFVMPDYSKTSNGCATSFYPELAVFALNGTTFDKVMSKISAVAAGSCKLGTDEQYFAQGKGTAADPYLIYTAQQLSHVREHMGSGICFKVMCDIDTSGWNAIPSGAEDTFRNKSSGWDPIGDFADQFRGTFDGNGFVIRNLTINTPGDDYIGLFGCIGPGGTIKNVVIAGGSVSGRSYVGGVIGCNYGGTVLNCSNAAAVNGNGYEVGGMVGQNYGGTVLSSFNTGAVGGGNNAGGMVGQNYGGTVSNCSNGGTVSGNNAGGVVGYNDGGTVLSSFNTGAVSGGNNAGGVVGYSSNSTISGCYNTAAVTGGSGVGGVTGDNYGGTISNCYNTGAATGSGTMVGGVAGSNDHGTISNCYNTGAATGNNYVGGLVGGNDYADSTLSDCYSTGTVSGTGGYVGAAVGYNVGVIENSYFNVDNCSRSGIGTDPNATGGVGSLTTAEMVSADAVSVMGLPAGTFEKRDADGGYCYYPELYVFVSSTDAAVQAASKTGVAVERITPDISGASAEPIPRGSPLGDSMLSMTATYGKVIVDGTPAWDDDSIVPAASDSGVTHFGYTFTPSSELYKPVSGTTVLTVYFL